jgi:hypothetical protein
MVFLFVDESLPIWRRKSRKIERCLLRKGREDDIESANPKTSL